MSIHMIDLKPTGILMVNTEITAAGIKYGSHLTTLLLICQYLNNFLQFVLNVPFKNLYR